MSVIYGADRELVAITTEHGTWYGRTALSYTEISRSQTKITYEVKYGISWNPVNASGFQRREVRILKYVDGTPRETERGVDYSGESPFWISNATETLEFNRTTTGSSTIRGFKVTFAELVMREWDPLSLMERDETFRFEPIPSAILTATLAIPARNQYTVSFNANGHGTAPSSQSIFYGYKASTPTAPTETGWTFGGWYKEEACTNAWNFSTDTVTGNTTLYAKWTVNTYTITYNNNGGSGSIASQSKKYDQAITLANTGFTKKDTYSQTSSTAYLNISNAVREWVQSSNWYTNSSGSGTNYPRGSTLAANTISTNTTLYAIWTATYIYPTITNLKIIRTKTASNDDTTEYDDGEYLYITFKWTQFSNNNGTNFSTPTCKITVDSYTYTPSLGTTCPFAYKPQRSFSQDTSHTVTVELYDSSNTSHKATASTVVPTAILPIDLYGNGTNVWMGIMHPYETNTKLMMSGFTIDGNILYKGSNKTSPAISFLDNTNDEAGNGIIIGDSNGSAGGLVIVGAGESPGYIKNWLSSANLTAGSEYLLLGADQTIKMYTNVQNGMSTAKLTEIDTSGKIIANGFYTSSIGGGQSDSFATTLQSYFNSNKANIARNSALHYYSSAHGNGTLLTGYFLTGYDSGPYGGFYACHYLSAKYIGISGGGFTEYEITKTATSSRKTKENIQKMLTSEARKLYDIEVVSFDYKEKYEGGKKNQFGVIAEDCDKLIPNAVYKPDTNPDTIWGIDYTKFVPYLIKCLQLQKNEIEELKLELKKVQTILSNTGGK